MKFRELLKAWLPVAFWMGLMFLGSTDLLSSENTSRYLTPFLHWLKPDISGRTVAEIHVFVRKAAHVTEYAILTGLFFRALRWPIDGFWARASIAMLPALLFAPLDEWHQSFVPTRTSSPVDVLIDYCGAFLGIAICRALHLRLSRSKVERSALSERV